MKREVVSRCIINILNVKHSYDYERFSTPDLYNELLNYGKTLYSEDIYSEYKRVIENNKTIIECIANDSEYLISDYNSFMEQLRAFKRKYILKK